MSGQLEDELSELADGSISLFVILPIFRGMLISDSRAMALARFEASIGEHLAHLDSILDDVFLTRDRSDGDLTQSLFRSLTEIRARPQSTARDEEILGVVQQAQLFLLGCCSFALRLAHHAGAARSAQVLKESLTRIGSLAAPYTVSDPPLCEESCRITDGVLATGCRLRQGVQVWPVAVVAHDGRPGGQTAALGAPGGDNAVRLSATEDVWPMALVSRRPAAARTASTVAIRATQTRWLSAWVHRLVP